ncbi:hypothetical protein GUITHDRAFT_153135, partial [Guillardia theta CCMP2712]
MPRLTRILALLATSVVADAFLTSAPVGLQAASKKASLPRFDQRRRDCSPRMAKTFGPTDFKVNWMQPNAQGSFGKVFFASQGFAGMGGQVVIKCPVNQKFAMSTFETEMLVNEKLDKSFPNPRWAKFLGRIELDASQIPADMGSVGIVFKKENGETLEDLLLSKQNVAGKVGCKSESGVRPELCKKVMKELLQTCVQLHSVGVMHRDIKPENILVSGSQLKLLDFGSSCDVQANIGINDVSLDPIYAPPEKRIQPQQPGKFDVYCVAM